MKIEEPEKAWLIEGHKRSTRDTARIIHPVPLGSTGARFVVGLILLVR
jgi:hypothetical protein